MPIYLVHFRNLNRLSIGERTRFSGGVFIKYVLIIMNRSTLPVPVSGNLSINMLQNKPKFPQARLIYISNKTQLS